MGRECKILLVELFNSSEKIAQRSEFKSVEDQTQPKTRDRSTAWTIGHAQGAHEKEKEAAISHPVDYKKK